MTTTTDERDALRVPAASTASSRSPSEARPSGPRSVAVSSRSSRCPTSSS
ncbi:hypothetical protein NKG05_18895 [Oerskovia sp. M15]